MLKARRAISADMPTAIPADGNRKSHQVKLLETSLEPISNKQPMITNTHSQRHVRGERRGGFSTLLPMVIVARGKLT